MVSERRRGAPAARSAPDTPRRGVGRADGAGRVDGVGRERVSGIQRGRILAAMTEVAAERGAGNVTVAHVVARSGVSRRTFYELFEDREACFLEAFDEAIARIAGVVLPAYESEKGWRGRMRAGLAALLDFLDEEPQAGRLCVVETLAAGPRALERRAQVLAAVERAVDQGRKEARGRRAPSPLAAEGVTGGVLSVLHARLARDSMSYAPCSQGSVSHAPRARDSAGRPGRGSFGELLGPLMGLVVLPYLDAAAAARELERPRPPRPGRRGAPPRDPLRDLDMRLTYRTVRVLIAVAAAPGASNRQLADASDVADQGQISKLLARLQTLGLIENTGAGHAKGEPNAWRLTARGREIGDAIQAQAGGL